MMSMNGGVKRRAGDDIADKQIKGKKINLQRNVAIDMHLEGL